MSAAQVRRAVLFPRPHRRRATGGSGQLREFLRREAIVFLRSVTNESHALLLENLSWVIVLVGIGPTEAGRD
jgi:hypothetical protein